MSLNYNKIFVLILFFIFSVVTVIALKPTTEKVDEKTFLLFDSSENKKALFYAEELEKYSKNSKYPLYQAYILRELDEISKSNSRLKRALIKAKKEGRHERAFEIQLNLALNAYLKKENILLKSFITEMLQLQNSKSSLKKYGYYLSIFRGIDAYIDKDYEKAIDFFEQSKHYNSNQTLSKWMKCSFDRKLPKNSIDHMLIHARIETSEFDQAKELLKDWKSKNSNEIILKEELLFFKAYKQLKKSIKEKQEISKSLEKIQSSLEKIRNKAHILEKQNLILKNLYNEVLISLDNNDFQSFILTTQFLDLLNDETDLELFLDNLLSKLKRKLFESEEDRALKLIDSLPYRFYVKLLYKIQNELKETLKKKNEEDLIKYNALIKHLKNEPLFNERTYQEEISFLILDLILNSEKNNIDTLFDFWTLNEADRNLNANFANNLIEKGEKLWLNQGMYEKAKDFFYFASKISSSEKTPEIQEKLEKTLRLIQKKAMRDDDIKQHIPLINTLKTLKLNPLNLYDKQDKNQILEDALYFFHRGYPSKAVERISVILNLDDENEEANRLLYLIAYESGDLTGALKALEKIKQKDASVLEIIQKIQQKL